MVRKRKASRFRSTSSRLCNKGPRSSLLHRGLQISLWAAHSRRAHGPSAPWEDGDLRGPACNLYWASVTKWQDWASVAECVWKAKSLGDPWGKLQETEITPARQSHTLPSQGSRSEFGHVSRARWTTLDHLILCRCHCPGHDEQQVQTLGRGWGRGEGGWLGRFPFCLNPFRGRLLFYPKFKRNVNKI